MDTEHHTGTSVYRYYDQDDILLYVGITSRGMLRQREHNSTKEWWPFVTRQEVEHYDQREDACSRERNLISKFHPPFNTQHNPDHLATRAAYLTLRKPGNSGEKKRRSLRAASGRTRIAMRVRRIGKTLILTSVEGETEKMSGLDLANVKSAIVAFPDLKGTRATIESAKRAVSDGGGSLRLVVRCQHNAEKCSAASVLMRLSSSSREKTVKRIDLLQDAGPEVAA